MKLEIQNLSKSYGEKPVLKAIDFTFEEGKIYGLLGRNGAGKTTFFNALNGDITIDSGKFYLETDYGKTKLKTKDIGYVISTPIVPEFLTAREFLQIYLDLNEDKNQKSVDEYFDLVKISKKDQNILLKDYSHGMKNKIQMLMNIIANPKIILLDEPLTSLDIVIQEDMKKLLKKIKKNHITILSTHILELALDLCDEIIILSNHELSKVEMKDLNRKKYKEQIINQLKEDNYEDTI